MTKEEFLKLKDGCLIRDQENGTIYILFWWNGFDRVALYPLWHKPTTLETELSERVRQMKPWQPQPKLLRPHIFDMLFHPYWGCTRIA